MNALTLRGAGGHIIGDASPHSSFLPLTYPHPHPPQTGSSEVDNRVGPPAWSCLTGSPAAPTA